MMFLAIIIKLYFLYNRYKLPMFGFV